MTTCTTPESPRTSNFALAKPWRWSTTDDRAHRAIERSPLPNMALAVLELANTFTASTTQGVCASKSLVWRYTW